jgi:hypothetical protein
LKKETIRPKGIYFKATPPQLFYIIKNYLFISYIAVGARTGGYWKLRIEGVVTSSGSLRGFLSGRVNIAIIFENLLHVEVSRSLA